MKSNQEFKNEALAALQGNWTPAVLATLVVLAIIMVASGPSVYSTVTMSQMTSMNTEALMDVIRRTNGLNSLQMILSILVVFPLGIGFMNAFKELLFKGDNQLLSNTFRIGLSNYWHKVWGYLLMYILIILWSFLLIIPGIIKAFSYAMTPFILDENPELGASEAIHRSRMMMKNHKFDLFWLYLSFIGWFLLCCITCGIGFLWLTPYIDTAKAAFYEEVKADYALNGGLD